MATNNPIFGISTEYSAASYPTAGNLIFGAEYANRDFVVPMAKFTFYDALGVPLDGVAPTIYVRLGGQFNTALLNGYQAVSGIMGDPTSEKSAIFTGEAGKVLGKYGDAFVGSIQKQIVNAIAGATGYAASAGQTGKAQVEFLQRKFLNTFQQLVYQGPSFRQFQLPFNMKPSSSDEAEVMLSIISTFRVASSPRAGTNKQTIDEVIDEFGRNENTADVLNPPDRKDFPDGPEGDAAYNAALQEYNKSNPIDPADITDMQSVIDATPNVLVLGYPDMCRFELVLYDGDELVSLFKSDFCVIGSVGLDYGTGNKMNFFQAESGSTQYYPTDVNLTIALTEVNLITAEKATAQYNDDKVIL